MAPGLRDLMRALHRQKYLFKAKFDRFDEPRIIAYRSWGTSRFLRVSGRLVEQEKLTHPDADDGLFENLANATRHIESDEIPSARLELSYRGVRQLVVTDEEGFFHADLPAALPLDGGVHRVGIRLLESMAGGSGLEAAAEVWVPAPEGGRIVISDVDDTVVVTGARDALQKTRRFVTKNAKTRRPFPGVPAFYRALQRASAAVFYVSRTGWNFYDQFIGFMDHHDIPAGPLMMRDLAIVEPRSRRLSRYDEKLATISEILDAFPEHRFVMIGDSGQGDAAVYAECAEKCGRVDAVYIRMVDERDVDPEAAERIRAVGVPLCVTPLTAEMAYDAAERGVIARADAREVDDEIRRGRSERERGRPQQKDGA